MNTMPEDIKKPRLIVEVALEMALTPDLLDAVAKLHGRQAAWEAAMASSVGGIGPLLHERIISQAQHTEVIGVSLLYANVWAQGWHTWGQLNWRKKTVAPFWREVLTNTGQSLSLTLFDGSTVSVKVWKAPFGNATVYFLDHPDINDVIYPGPEDAPPGETSRETWATTLRLKQSWILGRGTLALLKTLGKKPDLVIQSETPTVFVNHRLVQDELQSDPFFEQTRYIFNDHTPLEYAHPIWHEDTLAKIKLDPRYVKNHPAWLAERQGLDVTCLLVSLDEGTYGVSQKHARVMKNMPTLAAFSEKIDAVTNGVSPSLWQSDDLNGADHLSDQQLLSLKDAKRKELKDWLWRRYKLWHTWKSKMQDQPLVLWTRRVTSYKRLDIVGHILQTPSLRARLLATDVVLLVGGRIHESDTPSQELMYRLLDMIGQDSKLEERIVVIDNFNVWEARRLYQGADAAVMLSDQGREASATGFMKAQLNGGLIICNEDGAIPESVIFKGKETAGQVPNGFEVKFHQGKPTPEGFLGALEAFSAVFRNKEGRSRMIRSALAAKPSVDIERTTRDLFVFYDKVFARCDRQRAAYEKGRGLGLEASKSAPGLDQVRSASAPGTFSWHYGRDGVKPVPLLELPRSLPELLQGFRWVLTLGTVGEWALLFHSGTKESSLLSEARQIIDQNPTLKTPGVEGFLMEIAQRSQTAAEKLYKEEMLAIQYELMGFIEGWTMMDGVRKS